MATKKETAFAYKEEREQFCKSVSDFADTIVLDLLYDLLTLHKQWKQDYEDFLNNNICTLDEYTGATKILGEIKKFVIEKMKEID